MILPAVHPGEGDEALVVTARLSQPSSVRGKCSSFGARKLYFELML